MRLLLKLGAAIVALVAVAALAAYFYLRQSLPRIDGELRLAGVSAPVEILRDPYGIPHIFARNEEDAAFALGFAHAQDRLWQMEMNRRIAAGRLSEVLGPRALDTDRFLRTLGIRRVAEANLRALDAPTVRLLEAYAAGVNAFLASGPVLPIEFWLTGARPEPWTPADSVAWAKMMAWDLGGNWRNELLRLQLARTLPLGRIQEFVDRYPGEAPPAIADLKTLYDSLDQGGVQLAEDAGQLLARAPGAPPDGVGSNNWVVSGAHTRSGKPLLANDPHLGLTAPPVWYFAHLAIGDRNVIGATLPGLPAIVLGRNDRIAWGFTNTGPDVQDLYLEKLDAAGRYLAPDGPRPFRIIEETIRVKGAPDETLRVRVSRHGPIISDVYRPVPDRLPRGYAIAFAWTALLEDDHTLQAARKIMRATSWQEFLEAARDYQVPQQNMVYADRDGNIGFIAPGRVPIRKPENDLKGLAPAPGWEAKYDWDGWIPFEQLPRQFNPASGLLWSANEKITPPGYAYFITSEWAPPYRARRIEELLEAQPRHDSGSFARMQADVLSLALRDALPRLLETQPRSERARRALAMLAAWDARMSPERPEPLIAWAWWREFTRALYADELGPAFEANWTARAPFVANVLAGVGDYALWCDDVRTPRVETCGELLGASLEAALDDLERRYGSDPAQWRWGEAHYARHEHRPFGRQPLLARWFNIRFPTPGDTYTINVGRNRFDDEARPFASQHAASLRAIYDLADPENSLFIHSGGQSGNRLSPHYEAFTAAWAKNEYIRMTTARATLEAAAHHTLRLNPAR